MNLKRCADGHFYDADKYTSCPHCNPTTSASEVTVAMASEEIVEPEDRTMSLADAVSEATSSAAAEPAAPADEQKTVGFYVESFGTDPVVGWLVCIEGDHYGKSFPLKSGRNFIGRNANMDVALVGDTSVSRERHAIVIYEPKARCFIAQAGDSRELFYLNDDVVLNNELLKSYDVLSIGNEKLLFMALCGPQFCWEDTKK